MASAAVLPALHELSHTQNQLTATENDESHAIASGSNLSGQPIDYKERMDDLLRCKYKGCGKSFSKLCKLEDHILVHTGERPFCCEYPGCTKSFRRNDHLKRHMRSHLSNNSNSSPKGDPDAKDPFRPFQCTLRIPTTISQGQDTKLMQCSKRFLTKQHLIRHIREVHDYSTSCDEQSALEEATKKILKDDKVEHSKKRKRGSRLGEHPCTIAGCSEVFPKRKLLRSHINFYHSDKGKVFDDLDKEEAARIARLPFPCTEEGCDKRFATNTKRIAHIQERHEQIKALPYVCSHEDHVEEVLQGRMTRFATWTDLQAHQREEHKPICKHCKKYFKDGRNLRVHQKRFHALLDEEERDEMSLFMENGMVDKIKAEKSVIYPFVCGEPLDLSRDSENAADDSTKRCTKRFISKYNRDIHIRTVHRGEKPFSCPHEACQRRFGSKRASLRHSYKCSFASQLNENDADLSDNDQEDNVEDIDDDFFRREGGAVPESNADRPRTQKRKIEHAIANMDNVAGTKKRKVRGRILSCPWPKICQMRDEEEREKSTEEIQMKEKDQLYTCSFRFSRLYDVQRHLLRQHGLALAQIDLCALLDEKETIALGQPRKGTQIAIEEEALEEEEELGEE